MRVASARALKFGQPTGMATPSKGGGRSRHQRQGGLGRRFNPAKRLVPLSRLGWAATGSECPLVNGLMEGIDDVTHKGGENSGRPADADTGIGSSRANLGRLGTR